MEFRLPLLFWGRQQGCLRSVSKIKPPKERRLLEDMRAKTTSTSSDKASKSTMYRSHYTTISVSQGPRRSVEMPLDEIDPCNIPKPARRRHHRPKRAMPKNQPASPSSYENSTSSVEEPKVEGLKPGQWSDEYMAADGTYSWREKRQPDGRIQVQYKTTYYPSSQQRHTPKKDINDPRYYLATRDPTNIDPWPPAPPPVQEEEEEEVEDQDDSSDEENVPPLDETTDPNIIPVYTTNVPRSGWADPQVHQDQHPPLERYHEKHRHNSTHNPHPRKPNRSRRNSITSTAPINKPSRLAMFFYPVVSRKIMQTGRTQSNRVGEWMSQVEPGLPYDDVYHDVYLPDESSYRRQGY